MRGGTEKDSLTCFFLNDSYFSYFPPLLHERISKGDSEKRGGNQGTEKKRADIWVKILARVQRSLRNKTGLRVHYHFQIRASQLKILHHGEHCHVSHTPRSTA